MTLILSGTDGLSDIDGSAATPAIRGTDTNTGIFFPAADTIAFSEGGVEAMRIDSSGNVGIGTSSPSTRLDVNGNIAGGSLNVFGTGVPANGINNVATNALGFFTNSTEQARITSAGLFQFNSGYGSVATAYGCRAWVNFNGTGVVAIRASGNVTSITDGGVGIYTVNLTTALPDTNYSVVGTQAIRSTTFTGGFGVEAEPSTTSACLTRTYSGGALGDLATVSVSIFR